VVENPSAQAAGNRQRWLTLANAISALRLAAAPASVALVLAEQWPLAALLFVAAVASDFLDGIVARRTATASRIGGVLDHTADAAYVASTLWAIGYVETQHGMDLVPGILPLFIAVAFLQYVLDSRALAGRPLRTSRLGRINGIAYFVLAGAVLLRRALDLDWLPDAVIYWAGLAIVASTLLSMIDRLRALLNTVPQAGRQPDQRSKP
jgi:phosphatidylglycerophosphate synthase